MKTKLKPVEEVDAYGSRSRAKTSNVRENLPLLPRSTNASERVRVFTSIFRTPVTRIILKVSWIR
jgi:hypothetical protein